MCNGSGVNVASELDFLKTVFKHSSLNQSEDIGGRAIRSYVTMKNLVDTEERMRNYFDHDSSRREDNGKRIIREDRRFCWPLILYN